MATWAEVKAQAADRCSASQLEDIDVLERAAAADRPVRPLHPGPERLPAGRDRSGDLVEGNPGRRRSRHRRSTSSTGHAFLDDIAHNARPVGATGPPDQRRRRRRPDTDPATPRPGTYDDELLDAHFITGDGRGNENIGLTAVHNLFHSEHNRLVEDIDRASSTADPGVHRRLACHEPDVGWGYGERLFQAARFVTEMEYQHLVFEEFARKVQPTVEPPFAAARLPHLDRPGDPGRVRARGLPLRALDADRDGGRATSPNGSDEQRHRADRRVPQPARVHETTAPRPDLTPTRPPAHRPRHDSRRSATRSTSSSPRRCATTCSGLPLDLPTINIARGREPASRR